jgi:uncharacterized coiled-coil protein SlyX
MREQLEQRLAELKAQFEHGRKVLADLEAQEAALRNTLLRISGAIEVIEEEFAKASQTSQAAGAQAAGDAESVRAQGDVAQAATVQRMTPAAA